MSLVGPTFGPETRGYRSETPKSKDNLDDIFNPKPTVPSAPSAPAIASTSFLARVKSSLTLTALNSSGLPRLDAAAAARLKEGVANKTVTELRIPRQQSVGMDQEYYSAIYIQADKTQDTATSVVLARTGGHQGTHYIGPIQIG